MKWISIILFFLSFLILLEMCGSCTGQELLIQPVRAWGQARATPERIVFPCLDQQTAECAICLMSIEEGQVYLVDCSALQHEPMGEILEL